MKDKAVGKAREIPKIEAAKAKRKLVSVDVEKVADKKVALNKSRRKPASPSVPDDRARRSAWAEGATKTALKSKREHTWLGLWGIPV